MDVTMKSLNPKVETPAIEISILLICVIAIMLFVVMMLSPADSKVITPNDAALISDAGYTPQCNVVLVDDEGKRYASELPYSMSEVGSLVAGVRGDNSKLRLERYEVVEVTECN